MSTISLPLTGLWLRLSGFFLMLSGPSLVFQSFGFNSLRQDIRFRYSVLAFGGIADEPGSLGEEFPHLLQGQLFRFREHGPEEDGIGEIADLDTECQLPVKVPPSILGCKREIAAFDGCSPRTGCRISIQSLPFQWVSPDRSLC
jgi:hypothetical protein